MVFPNSVFESGQLCLELGPGLVGRGWGLWWDRSGCGFGWEFCKLGMTWHVRVKAQMQKLGSGAPCRPPPRGGSSDCWWWVLPGGWGEAVTSVFQTQAEPWENWP